jgi:hypothetical protein
MKDKSLAIARYQIPPTLRAVILGVRQAQLAEAKHSLEAQKAELLSFELRYSQKVLRKYEELQERESDLNKEVEWSIPEEEEPTTQPDPMLRELFRELAKMAHPDHSVDLEDEKRRSETMAAASEALHAGDLLALERLLKNWEEAPEARGLLQQIRRLEHRIYHCSICRSRLRESSMWSLMETEKELLAQGRDMLEELAALVQSRIDAIGEQT